MLSSRLTALTSPPNHSMATMVSAACIGVVAVSVTRLNTKKAATASELTILASADIGIRSSYQPITNSASPAESTGHARPREPAGDRRAGDQPEEHPDAAVGRGRRAMPAIRPRRHDHTARQRDLAAPGRPR